VKVYQKRTILASPYFGRGIFIPQSTRSTGLDNRLKKAVGSGIEWLRNADTTRFARVKGSQSTSSQKNWRLHNSALSRRGRYLLRQVASSLDHDDVRMVRLDVRCKAVRECVLCRLLRQVTRYRGDFPVVQLGRLDCRHDQHPALQLVQPPFLGESLHPTRQWIGRLCCAAGCFSFLLRSTRVLFFQLIGGLALHLKKILL